MVLALCSCALFAEIHENPRGVAVLGVFGRVWAWLRGAPSSLAPASRPPRTLRATERPSVLAGGARFLPMLYSAAWSRAP